ncbi:DNA methyltransferase [Ralstonia mannitolilytica]|uniref:DNA methyltransferase n=1 Tax=Ralstonia mannitolilytica TaxID=105219 RepID=UPI000C7A2836|nr:DNA methyltransferase [Ralstonia mannitolilytica]PLT18580.1 SAM-dependent methyltransferase [Ralstonia mannitolilytica]
MNIAQVEEKVKALVGEIKQADFLYDLLECYGKPKASITRLKMVGKGSYNLSKNADEVLWKKQVYFKATNSDKLLTIIDEMKHADVVSKHQPRFIIAINATHLLAIDTRTEDTLDIPLAELNKKFDFFLPWAGLEKTQAQGENPADVKAAEKMAKLFDLLRDNNPATTKEEIHWQNVFLSRILFCYFAEDTGIFSPKLFTNRIGSSTSEDGSDLDDYLGRIFDVMNQESREGIPDYLNFPYVNGGLFADKLPIPKFNRKSRAMLIECGADLNWSEINPDIFGSMIQAVVDPSQRGNMGMHYTSVPNIMKVIEPLFLNELKEEFERHSDSKIKLEQLLLRLEHLKIFDPACGSGNFLIIAYKELRELEMEVFKRLQELSKEGLMPLSRIKLSQFYGIELDDFAHEIAILSLWLKEHQMNLKFKALFGHASAALPLKNSGNILCANSATTPWTKACPYTEGSETFIIGNPPYLGARQQSKEQKEDVYAVFGDAKGISDLDYIAVWFQKAGDYIRGQQAKCAFVSTNSITQGVQVAILWPRVLREELEICFAHTSFKWANNAKKNAAVICVVIGLRNISTREKAIYSEGMKLSVQNINGYLAPASNLYVSSRKSPLATLPPINYGSFALDDGFYTLSEDEKDQLIAEDVRSKDFIRTFIGAKELIQGGNRYCLWLQDDYKSAKTIPPIKKRVDLVQKWREKSDRDATRKLAATPHLFAEIRQPNADFLAVPTISSERREYLPIAFFPKEVIASNQLYVVPNATAVEFGILSSKMHIVWVKAVSGQLKTDTRYTAAIAYNNFPIPKLTEQQRSIIAARAVEIIAARETYPENSLADLYDPEDMPADLRQAHEDLDEYLETCYRGKAFSSDAERLESLFKLYEKMTGIQNA